MKTSVITIKDTKDGGINISTDFGMGNDNQPFKLVDEGVTMAVKMGVSLYEMTDFHPEGVFVLAKQMKRGDVSGALKTVVQLIEDQKED